MRVEFTLRPPPDAPEELDRWQVGAAGWRVPVRLDRDGEGPALVFALRYRSFVPWQGLHPTLGVQTPVPVILRSGADGPAFRLVVHEWKPEGGGYDGLPEDFDEARQRRRARVLLEPLAHGEIPDLQPPPALAINAYGLDLRACPAGG